MVRALGGRRRAPPGRRPHHPGRTPLDGLHVTNSTEPPPSAFCLIPSESGAGVVACGKVAVPLPSTQYALLSLLAERYLADASAAAGARLRAHRRAVGAAPVGHRAPRTTTTSSRRSGCARVEKAGIDDPNRFRHGFGYRLLVEPVTDR